MKLRGSCALIRIPAPIPLGHARNLHERRSHLHIRARGRSRHACLANPPRRNRDARMATSPRPRRTALNADRFPVCTEDRAQGRPQVRWEERWGAIVMDAASGMTGIGGSQPTEEAAIQAATAMCQRKGGKNCRVDITYSNQCGALAWAATMPYPWADAGNRVRSPSTPARKRLARSARSFLRLQLAGAGPVVRTRFDPSRFDLSRSRSIFLLMVAEKALRVI